MERFWHIGRRNQWPISLDVFPRPLGPFIRPRKETAELELVVGQWGLIPWSFDEPCWESGRNVWWRLRRADGAPWGLAGLWNAWLDKSTGEVIESYTMFSINADSHPLMSRMHRPDPRLPPNEQDKRSVVAIESGDVETWLSGSPDAAAQLMHPPSVELIDAASM